MHPLTIPLCHIDPLMICSLHLDSHSGHLSHVIFAYLLVRCSLSILGLTTSICTLPTQYRYCVKRRTHRTADRTLISSLFIHNKSNFRCQVVLSTNNVCRIGSMRYKDCDVKVHRTRVSLPYCHHRHFHTVPRRNGFLFAVQWTSCFRNYISFVVQQE